MKYMSIFNLKHSIPDIAKVEDTIEWDKVSKDGPLHSKCKMIRCYELMSGTSHKVVCMIDTDEPDALRLLAQDMGSKWSLETYPIHEVWEKIEEDHSVVAG